MQLIKEQQVAIKEMLCKAKRERLREAENAKSTGTGMGTGMDEAEYACISKLACTI